jgi:hypothetical protein
MHEDDSPDSIEATYLDKTGTDRALRRDSCQFGHESAPRSEKVVLPPWMSAPRFADSGCAAVHDTPCRPDAFLQAPATTAIRPSHPSRS